MNLGWSLFIWLIIFIIIFVLLRALKLGTVPSFAGALLIGYVYLMAYVPLTSGLEDQGGWVFIYALLIFFTPLFIIVYLALLVTKYVPKADTRNPFVYA